MPQISVIVPVYKVEKYIKRCVDSILAQTFTDFELILVDDGSPDNCGDICDEYAIKDNRVTVIHQKNGGLSAARNAGIDWVFANSDSEWISFIDSDDWVHEKYLEALFTAVQQTGMKTAICRFARSNGEKIGVNEELLYPIEVPVEKYYCENNTNAVVAWGKLYQKKDFVSIRYPLGKIHEDEYTTYRILFQSERVAVVDQPLYAYFQNIEGIIHTSWTIEKLNIMDALEQQGQYFKKNKKIKAYKMSRDVLCFYLYKNISEIEKLKENYPEINRLRRYLGWVLLFEAKKTIKNNESYYEKAFPKTMWLYWTIVGIGNKLKSSFS